MLLAKHHPQNIYFTGRNADSAKAIISQVGSTNPEVGATFTEYDFSSLPAIEVVKGSKSPHLDILMCNSGIMAQPAILTQDVYDMQSGVNHLAPSKSTANCRTAIRRPSCIPYILRVQTPAHRRHCVLRPTHSPRLRGRLSLDPLRIR